MGKVVIQDVSDTALWVAVYRANETKRPDALFRDPFAHRLVGERGRYIASKMSRSRYVSWSTVLRTHIIDNFFRELMGRGVDTVLNLGAGLDTRPYRLDLPSRLRWIEVDYPQINRLKEEELGGEKPKCRLERVAMDLTDRELRRSFFRRINGETKKAAILTEGVTYYLTEEQVALLAQDLRAQNNFRFWITDYFSPRTALYMLIRKGMKETKNAPYQFCPEDWFGFFAAVGWKALDIRYLGEESIRVRRRIPMLWWMKVVRLFLRKKVDGGALRTSAYVLLEPK
ncbi:hypothetical protein XI06_24835 [Bradyrhizobium sp. CCBAU 11434]|uniref:class I SAM-dependent methyltransferase n=1 Tax=Bradyrhizobium sp. CCBAU 11434 TaxID=1630885 RepID=UPI0023052477|nr:class I SAM-dependent methyltransferase [Bradyrhizobium sp. CCBAU 11434]MDA9523412.1 hypothetical protein [Bradyrhizobium sp. CCBAU 11434]